MEIGWQGRRKIWGIVLLEKNGLFKGFNFFSNKKAEKTMHHERRQNTRYLPLLFTLVRR